MISAAAQPQVFACPPGTAIVIYQQWCGPALAYSFDSADFLAKFRAALQHDHRGVIDASRSDGRYPAR